MYDKKKIREASQRAISELRKIDVYNEEFNLSAVSRYSPLYNFSKLFGGCASIVTLSMFAAAFHYFVLPFFISTWYLSLMLAILIAIQFEIGKRYFTKNLAYSVLNKLKPEMYILVLVCVCFYLVSGSGTLSGAMQVVYQPNIIGPTQQDDLHAYFDSKKDSLNNFKRSIMDTQLMLQGKGFITKAEALNKSIDRIDKEISRNETKRNREAKFLQGKLKYQSGHMFYLFLIFELIIPVCIAFNSCYDHYRNLQELGFALLEKDKPEPTSNNTPDNSILANFCDVQAVNNLSTQIARTAPIVQNMRVPTIPNVRKPQEVIQETKQEQEIPQEFPREQEKTPIAPSLASTQAVGELVTRKKVQTRKSFRKKKLEKEYTKEDAAYHNYFCQVELYMKANNLDEYNLPPFSIKEYLPKPDT